MFLSLEESTDFETMSQMRLVFLIVVTLFCWTHFTTEAAKLRVNKRFKCNSDDKKTVDLLVANIMTYGRPDRKFPQDAQGLKVYCRFVLKFNFF